MAEHDLRAVAFPTLNEAEIEKLGSCAGALLKKYPGGQTLFKDSSAVYLASLGDRSSSGPISGDRYLQSVEIVNDITREVRTLETPGALQLYRGRAEDRLAAEANRDGLLGFIRTGPALTQSLWTSHRPPFLLETSRPGVFAAGDVRSGSTKRVASAVGEGAMAVQFVEEYLKEM